MAQSVGDEQEWKLHQCQFHADDHTIGQMYIDVYRKYGDESMIKTHHPQFAFIRYHCPTKKI